MKHGTLLRTRDIEDAHFTKENIQIYIIPQLTVHH